MNYTEANIAACQNALYLLRQDANLPTVATAETDTSLEWKKCKVAFATAVREVWDAHDWNCQLGLDGTDLQNAPEDCTNWSPAMVNALTYCIARELAIPLAGRVSDLSNWQSLYSVKLDKARALSLEIERKADTDPVHTELLQLLVPTFSEKDAAMPRSVKSLTDRIETLKESARIHVLADHSWNFAREKSPVVSCHVPHGEDRYPFAATLPADCAHVEAVFTEGGRINDWKIYNTTICAMEPIRGVVYVRNMKKVEKWNPLVYRVFIFRLAADAATVIAPDKVQLMEARYAQALSEAKCRDARESNTPKDAWGENYYVNQMQGRGRFDQRPRGPRHAFHGLI